MDTATGTSEAFADEIREVVEERAFSDQTVSAEALAWPSWCRTPHRDLAK